MNKEDKLYKEQIDNIKTKAFYEEIIRAWFNTKMQCDKSTFCGSLVLLAANFANILFDGAKRNFEFVISGFNIISASICILSLVIIFDKNADLLESLWWDEEPKCKLGKYDNIVRFFFVLSLFSTAFLFIAESV